MRHAKPGLTAADQITNRTYLGLDLFGQPVWQLSGHDDDDTDPDGGAGDDDDDADDDEDDEDEDDDADDGKPKKKGKHAKDDDDEDEDDDDKPMYSKKDMDKVRARMRAADKRASDLQAQLARRGTRRQSADDSKTTPEPDAALTKRVEAAESTLRQTRLENAFFRANAVDWIDPTDALRLVDLSDVDVDEDGTVDTKALARALRVLAKRKPHLVKAKKASGPADDDSDDDDTDQRSGGPTAPKMNGKRTGRKATTQDQLRGKFSALRNR